MTIPFCVLFRLRIAAAAAVVAARKHVCLVINDVVVFVPFLTFAPFVSKRQLANTFRFIRQPSEIGAEQHQPAFQLILDDFDQ